MKELTCKVCDDVKILCDEGTTAVTCSKCVMKDIVWGCDSDVVGIS